MGGNILGIFAKEPVAGRVKTRLAAETSPEFAAGIADAFVRDTLRKCAPLAERRFLAYAPPSAQDYFAPLARAYALEIQGEGDLGQRLAQFFQAHGADQNRVVVLGTDSPTLPADYILQAFRELERAHVVLGPATDGGYYLVGCSGPCLRLFDNIAWSGAEVLGQTVMRVRDGGLRLALLPPWYDVDTLADLKVMRGHLCALRQAGIDPGAEWTERIIQHWEMRDASCGHVDVVAS